MRKAMRAGLMSALLLVQLAAQADNPADPCRAGTNPACMKAARSSADKPLAWAYMAWWMPDSWRNPALEKLDRILFFELTVKANGHIDSRHGWPEQWGEFRHAMKHRGTPIDLTLTLFEPKALTALFSSPGARARLLKEAVALASHEDVSGLQLDFEVYDPVPAATLAGLRLFMRELAQALHHMTPAKHISVFLPIGGASTLYDEETLAHVDNVVLQGYDSHWLSGPTAGPLSPLSGDEAVTWEKALAKGVELNVPRAKMLFSFPLYGYEWPVRGSKARGATAGPGAEVSFAPLKPGLVPAIKLNVQDRIAQYGAQRDTQSGSVYYQFKAGQGRHVEGWFEDAWSLERKTDFLKHAALGGMAFFVLGYDGDELVKKYLDAVGSPGTAAPRGK
jgi:spore germination protein